MRRLGKRPRPANAEAAALLVAFPERGTAGGADLMAVNLKDHRSFVLCVRKRKTISDASLIRNGDKQSCPTLS